MNHSSRNTARERRPESDKTRRDFGKRALWVAPALTVLLAASSQPAAAAVGYPSGFARPELGGTEV